MAQPQGLQIADIKDGLYTWAKTVLAGQVSPDSVIWRNQSQPLPIRPCVTMKITDGPRRVGYSDNTQYAGDTTGKFQVSGQREMTVSVQVFGTTKIPEGKKPGPDAYQLAKNLNASLSKQTVLDALYASGIAVWNQGEVSNLTALEETEYEERAQFDLTLGVWESQVDDPGIIEVVNTTPNVTR